jgi:hypothetical protein
MGPSGYDSLLLYVNRTGQFSTTQNWLILLFGLLTEFRREIAYQVLLTEHIPDVLLETTSQTRQCDSHTFNSTFEKRCSYLFGMKHIKFTTSLAPEKISEIFTNVFITLSVNCSQKLASLWQELFIRNPICRKLGPFVSLYLFC